MQLTRSAALLVSVLIKQRLNRQDKKPLVTDAQQSADLTQRAPYYTFAIARSSYKCDVTLRWFLCSVDCRQFIAVSIWDHMCLRPDYSESSRVTTYFDLSKNNCCQLCVYMVKQRHASESKLQHELEVHDRFAELQLSCWRAWLKKEDEKLS